MIHFLEMYRRMSGNYDTEQDGEKKEISISQDGKIYMGSLIGNLRASDNQNEFPSSRGWFLWRYQTWYMYIRVRNGRLEMQRFSDSCNQRYQDIHHYCYAVTGVRRPPTNEGKMKFNNHQGLKLIPQIYDIYFAGKRF